MSAPFGSLFALRRAALVSQTLDTDAGASTRRALEAVAKFHDENHYAPSLTDLAGALGWTRERTRDAVRALSESGHLTAKPGVTRSLRVTTEAERLAARASAWYVALRDLPAVEVAAAKLALGRLGGEQS